MTDKVRLADQIRTLVHVMATPWIKNWGTAIDGGSYDGSWAELMARRFERVIAFEPDPGNMATIRRRFPDPGNIEFREEALLGMVCRVSVEAPPKRPGPASRYCVPGKGDVLAFTLDSFHLRHVGLIKLDLEGAEFDALAGARCTIEAWRPVLIVEFSGHGSRYGHSDDDLRALIVGMGYDSVLVARPDEVFVHRSAL